MEMTAVRKAMQDAYASLGWDPNDDTERFCVALEIELAKIEACLIKVKAGEPIFVLRGQDKLSYGLVLNWVERAALFDLGKAKQARALRKAAAMVEWPSRKMPD